MVLDIDALPEALVVYATPEPAAADATPEPAAGGAEADAEFARMDAAVVALVGNVDRIDLEALVQMFRSIRTAVPVALPKEAEARAYFEGRKQHFRQLGSS